MTEQEKPTLLLIDGHSLAFRAFYALSPDSFRTPDGQHTNAVHGFISMLLNILQGEKPSHLAVAFDLSRESFRTKLYPAYKGTRGETPPEFIGQTELLQEALAAMNIVTLTKPDYEADDILATLASQGEQAGFRVFVVSGDRDTFQLISDSVTILYPVKGVLNLARMDDEAVFEKYGLHARQYPDLAALVGETSDNLPGVPGVGPKTAAKWLSEYGDLAGVLAAAPKITGKVGESLREHSHLAERNRQLNHLLRDVELGVNLEDLRLGSVDETSVRSVFAKLHFRTLTERVLRLRGNNGTQTNHISPTQSASGNQEGASGKASASEPKSAANSSGASGSARVPRISELEIPVSSRASGAEMMHWLSSNRGLVGLNIKVESGRPVEIGVASETTRLFWAPGSEQEFKQLLGQWLESSDFEKVVFDAKALLVSLQASEVRVEGITHDPLLMQYLIDPVRRNFELDDIAMEHLGLEVKRENPNQLLAESTTDASLSAWLAVTLAPELHKSLGELGQTKVYGEIELPATFTLAAMEMRGVAVSRPKLEALFDSLSAEVLAIANQAYSIIGREINLSSPKQLQTVLFDELGMTGTKAVKTGFSTNAETLQSLFEQTQHPFLALLLEHRDANKIKQIVETLVKSIGPDGRIHTTYQQTGTSTGRLSSENPNLQNIPIKSERSRLIRDAFEVGPGFETLLTADYSQIEMRIMAHLSEDDGLIEAFKTGEDLHRFVGARIFGVAPSEVSPLMRSKVKAMSYGLVYGLSEYGLARQLKISNAEAKQLMADYFDRFGGVRRYLAGVVDRAKSAGYTETTYGRRRPFADLNSKVFQIRENARRAALNAPIQGTAADIMKLAMISVENRFADLKLNSRMLLQVHDELVFEVAKGELDQVKDTVVEIMQNIAELSVPLEVHVGVGPTWELAGH